jgi:hypothetical protein
MTKEEALVAIKALRNKIADVPDQTEDGGWVLIVCEYLDRASDVLEFAKS